VDNALTQEKPKTMPPRLKKNDHPRMVARGPMRHTSAQVAAEKACEEEGRKKKKIEETTNLQALTQMNVKSDEHHVLRKARAVRRISDIPEEGDEDIIDYKFIPLVDDDVSDSEGQDDEHGDEEEDEGKMPEDDVKEAMPTKLVKSQTKKAKQVSQG
jgi:hypothetical protein